MKAPLTFGLLLAAVSLFGQANFSPGHVVLNNGDTLKGLVMDEEWLYAPDQVNFKKSESESQTTFHLRDIRSFSSPYNTYVRYIVAYDPDDARARFLPRTRDPKWVTDTLLLKLLYKSTYSLFRTTTRNGRVHYFLATDTSKIPGGGIEELLHREWIIPDGYEMMMTNEWWKQYLINLSLSCGEQLTNQIKASSYNEKDITRLIEAINICKGGAIYQKPKPPALPRKRSRFGVAGSGFFYHLQTESGRSKFNSLHPAFGISYEAFSKRWPEKLAYYHELKYSSMEQPGIRQGNTLPATYSVQAIRLLTLIRLYFPNNKIAFYTNAGMSNGIPIKSTGRIEGTQFTNPVVFTEFEKGRLEQGFVLGVGVKLNPSGAVSLSLETRYQYETAFINPSEFDTGKSLNFVAVLQF